VHNGGCAWQWSTGQDGVAGVRLLLLDFEERRIRRDLVVVVVVVMMNGVVLNDVSHKSTILGVKWKAC